MANKGYNSIPLAIATMVPGFFVTSLLCLRVSGCNEGLTYTGVVGLTVL